MPIRSVTIDIDIEDLEEAFKRNRHDNDKITWQKDDLALK